MALVTLVPIALTTSAISIWLITCYYYYCKFNNGRNNNKRHASRENTYRSAHLLVVLGSGGHTAEMLSMLEHAPLDPSLYTHRTYVVSSGDSFSALKAVEFEKYLLEQQQRPPPSSSATAIASRGGASRHSSTGRKETPANNQTRMNNKKQKSPDTSASKTPSKTPSPSSYTIVTVPRARKVHQSYLTAPISTLHCLWICLCLLRGTHPDQKPKKGVDMPSPSPSPSPTSTSTGPLPSTPYPDIILANGPATAVCVILAAKILRTIASLSSFPFLFFQQQQQQQRCLRTIFVESWARVTTLSLSGKIVLPLVDRFLVQWDGLEGYSSWLGGKAEFVGALVR
ncbi:hypothetical protein EMCG_09350 [[Emmonsia] crescens]|uniref:UDP-N-acetylglucosamine transferase subunit ALG14 n=1 Tax=[Emmonsia] crescens TaxID=73230 RepID=A0A0G2J9X6_9EURO|nr:hypothetical protein EMCG_09350 [Emmonsia crescens UAMH 3008]